MPKCVCENWSLQDLAKALVDKNKDNKKIVVPMFQRGKRWRTDQEKIFIDSLIKGYPVGTMLFYESTDKDQKIYILVDGLQRGNCIKKYINNPEEFLCSTDLIDTVTHKVLETINKEDAGNKEKVDKLLLEFIKSQESFNNIQYYPVAKRIVQEMEVEQGFIEELISLIQNAFQSRQELYRKIANMVIPVIIYSGDEDTLPEIFDRINSQGTPLDKYEVYAASWPSNEKYKVDNDAVIDNVISKYDSLKNDGYTISNYNRDKMREHKVLTAFEYLFGFGKYLVNKYKILEFEVNIAKDAVNPIAFELINACLNDTDKIKHLYKDLRGIDINDLENAIVNAIEFVDKSIRMVTEFKGNTRLSSKVFHSKYQIMSMISSTFKEMYAERIYTELKKSWGQRKDTIAKNLVHYYVHDILVDYWREGGTGKIYTVSKSNRYGNAISRRAWDLAMDSFFEVSMQRRETQKIANVKKAEVIILNCIYLEYFTAADQLSQKSFDIEHIAPKEQMKKLIEKCHGSGLPISCISNLCYLPEGVNRSKQSKNFYQHRSNLSQDELKAIEEKYSFISEDDLKWMSFPYEEEDFSVLQKCYSDFCTKRFKIMKEKLYENLDIPSEDFDEKDSSMIDIVKYSTNTGEDVSVVDQLEKLIGIKLKHVSGNIYENEDGTIGYLIQNSRSYRQGNKKKYWYAYRAHPKSKKIEEYEKAFMILNFKDEDTMVSIPVPEILETLPYLRTSKNEDGGIHHWHIVLFINMNGKITWLISKPQPHEIDITDKRLK